MPDAQTVNVSELAEWLGLESAMRVQQLAGEGVVIKAKRGEYELKASIQGYIAFLKNSPRAGAGELAEQRLRREKAKADREELELKAMTGDLVDKGDAISAWGEAVQMMKTMLLSIPAKVAQSVRVAKSDAEAQRLIEERIKKALATIANVEIQRAETDAEDSRE